MAEDIKVFSAIFQLVGNIFTIDLAVLLAWYARKCWIGENFRVGVARFLSCDNIFTIDLAVLLAWYRKNIG